MTTESVVKFGIVGCGAVAGAHIGSVAGSPLAELAALVDVDVERARKLAADHGVSAALGDYRELEGKVDVAVLALPHHLHAPVAIDLMERGVNVLVEKPMALTTAECDSMIETAERTGRLLAVGQVRRYYLSSMWIKRAIDNGMLGAIRRFDMREGMVYNWPAASDFTFRRQSGGGVLHDAGVHALDTLLWWLGEHESLEYFDDAEGGVDADCELHLSLRCGARGVVELSRTRDLRNTVILEGERATLEVESKFNSRISLRLDGEPCHLSGLALPDSMVEEQVTDLFDRQVEDLCTALRDGRQPFITGREARRAVATIEACEPVRQPLELAWRSWEAPAGARS